MKANMEKHAMIVLSPCHGLLCSFRNGLGGSSCLLCGLMILMAKANGEKDVLDYA